MLLGILDFFRQKDGVDGFSLTDSGLVRSDNQDAYFVASDFSIICVADGMGGGKGGEVASRFVCEEVARVEKLKTFSERLKEIDLAIQRANSRVREFAEEHSFASMGSTAAILLRDNGQPARGVIAWIGDSRVYRRRNRTLIALTTDHRKSMLSHFLTRAISGGTAAVAEWKEIDFRKGDVYFVCSDGVHDMLPDSTINALILKGGTAKEMVERIGEAVRRAGARDNYTISLLKI